MKEVANVAKGNNSYIQSTHHISRQLLEEDYLVTEHLKKNGGENNYTKSLRGPTGTTIRAWPLKAEVLGLMVDVSAKKDAPLKNYANFEKDDDSEPGESVF